MKTILIWAGVLILLGFVISIPLIEEIHHIKEDPHYLDGRYELKNNFNDPHYYLPPVTPAENLRPVPCETVNTNTGTDYLN